MSLSEKAATDDAPEWLLQYEHGTLTLRLDEPTTPCTRPLAHPQLLCRTHALHQALDTAYAVTHPLADFVHTEYANHS